MKSSMKMVEFFSVLSKITSESTSRVIVKVNIYSPTLLKDISVEGPKGTRLLGNVQISKD